MIKTLSHWGILVECDTIGAQSPLYFGQQRKAAAVVLTATGEILVHRTPKTADVAIILDRHSGVLSSAQAQQVMQARHIALALADGAEEDISLKPVAANWRFIRSDYLTLAEWQAGLVSSTKNNHKGGENGYHSIVHR